jgi:hypothetical protein
MAGRRRGGTLAAERHIQPGESGMVGAPMGGVGGIPDPARVLDAAIQEQQAQTIATDLTQQLREEAQALGLSPEAFETVLRADPRLATQMIETQARTRRGESSDAGGWSGLTADDPLPTFRADELAQQLQSKSAEQLAAFARAALPETARRHWTIMYPPPRDDGYVLFEQPVPKVDVGRYAALGYSLVPRGPLLAEKEAQSEIVCGIHTSTGTVCQKRFFDKAVRRDHQEAKHPRELRALQEITAQERWELEQQERREQNALLREQVALLRRQQGAAEEGAA